MPALDDLRNIDLSLKNTIATFLADVAARLTGDVSADDVEGVVSDLTTEVAALQGADPGAPVAPGAPGAPVTPVTPGS
jgi:hypothetical protein